MIMMALKIEFSAWFLLAFAILYLGWRAFKLLRK